MSNRRTVAVARLIARRVGQSRRAQQWTRLKDSVRLFVVCGALMLVCLWLVFRDRTWAWFPLTAFALICAREWRYLRRVRAGKIPANPPAQSPHP